MTVTIEIDPNVRTHNNGTFSGFEDASGPVEVGDVVNVVEPESGLFGGACVTSVDEERRLIFLSVAWGTLTIRPYSGAVDRLAQFRELSKERAATMSNRPDTAEELAAQRETSEAMMEMQSRSHSWNCDDPTCTHGERP